MSVLDIEPGLKRITYQNQLDALKQALWKHVHLSKPLTHTGVEHLAKSNPN